MKHILFLFLCVAMSATVLAQSKLSPSFGINAGGVLAQVSAPDGVTTGASELKFGFSGGIYASIPLSDLLSIRPELNYAALGGKNTANAVTAKVNYLTIPLLASFRLDKSGFSAHVGPQYGLLLSASATDRGTTTDLKSQLTSTDLSLLGGITYMPGVVGVTVRYQYGLSNIVADKNSGYSWKNNGIYVTGVLRF